MTAREMQYDFKRKFNALDSQQNKDLKVPEIDIYLNEGQEVFVKIIAEPRFANSIGVEGTQRTIDDIRTIVVDQKDSEAQVTQVFDDDSYIASLPEDYWFYLNSKAKASKGNCTNIYLDTAPVQHDDSHERSVFNKSSFEWRIVNVRQNKDGIRIFTNQQFTVSKLKMEYIKIPRYIQNAQDWMGGTYTLLDGTVLTGTQSCELPKKVHAEIVDLAVLIAAGDINLSSYQYKAAKVNITKQ